MVSVIVPTYKEAPNIQPLVERLHASLSRSAIGYEVIIVDDNSQDGITEVVDELRSRAFAVRLISRYDERGLSSAVIRGFREAQGDILVCMDADLSHPPERVPDLLNCLADGKCEFAIGSRYISGGGAEERWGLWRRLNSRVATILARPFTSIKDPMAGFFALPKHVFDRATDLNPVGFKIGLELLVKCRCTDIRETPIIFLQRKRGKSKMGSKEQWNYLRHLKLLAQFKYGARLRFLEFCLIGSSGVLIDLSLYSVLLWLGVGIYSSRAVAVLTAMNWNFCGNKLFTFRYTGTRRLFHEYLGFFACCCLGAFVSWLASTVVALHTPYLRQHLLLSAIMGIVVGTATNFGLCETLVFRPSKNGQDGLARH